MWGALVSKSGVGRGHVACRRVGPQVSLASDALYEILAHTEVCCETAAGPVRRSIRGRSARRRPVPGRVPARSTSRACFPGSGSSSRRLRLPETAGATWRWWGETRRAGWPRFLRRRRRRGAAGSWRAWHEAGRQGGGARDLHEVMALCGGQMNRLSFKGHTRKRRRPDGQYSYATIWPVRAARFVNVRRLLPLASCLNSPVRSSR